MSTVLDIFALLLLLISFIPTVQPPLEKIALLLVIIGLIVPTFVK